MKKIIIVGLSLFLSIGLFSQKKTDNKGVIFNEGSLAESLAKAKSNKKGPNTVFLDCYTTWCGPCKQMTNEVFPMELVGTFFNSNFVNTKIDMEKGEGPELAKKYNIKAYPTFLILDADGNEINRVVGGGDAVGFIARVKKAMDPNCNPKVKYKAYLESKNRSTAKAYLEALEDSYMSKEAEDFIEEEFNSWSTKDRYSEDLWKYVSQSFSKPNSKIIDFVLADKLNADTFIGKQRVDKALCYGLKEIASIFVAGRIKNVDNDNFLAKINYLALLSTDDETVHYYVNISKLYAQSNMDQILRMINSRNFMQLGERERYGLEKLILSIKGFPKESTLEYLKTKADYFKSMAERSESTYKSQLEK